MRRLILILRLALGAVFLYAAYTKLSQPWLLFAMAIDGYQLLPQWAVLAVARTLPWAELALGLLLLAGFGLRWASAAVTALLAVFFALMIRSYAKGMSIDCGCFGAGDALSAKTLVRDGLLLASSGLLTFLNMRRSGERTPPDGQDRTAGPAGPEDLVVRHDGVQSQS